MKILGLTGSIGMGKSATAEMFREEGVPVYDADAAVHELYQPGGLAVEPLSERFDGVIVDGAVSRDALREIVLNDSQALGDLEAIIHPLVGQTQLQFRHSAEASGATFAVLDIPLLFETGGDQRCDYVAVVTAPFEVQKARVLARDGMSEDAFQAILDKQVPDAEKRKKADFVISSAFGFSFTRAHVRAIVDLMIRMDEAEKNV